MPKLKTMLEETFLLNFTKKKRKSPPPPPIFINIHLDVDAVHQHPAAIDSTPEGLFFY